MKKLVFAALIFGTASLVSCGGGEESGEAQEPKTVELSGNAKAMQIGQFDVVIAAGKYVDNYTSDDIKDMIKEGEKIVQLEIDVVNNTDVDLSLPPAAFVLDKVSTDKKENIAVDNLMSLKIDDYTMFDGDVGSIHKTGVLYYKLDADADLSDYQLNVLNTMDQDKYVGSIPLKDAGVKLPEPDSELSLSNNTLELEDIVFDGMGKLTIDKVTQNYQKEESVENPYQMHIRLDFTISCDKGTIYGSTTDFKLASNLLKNPIRTIDYELDNGSIDAGEEVSGYVVFSVPVGDSDFILVHSDEQELPLK